MSTVDTPRKQRELTVRGTVEVCAHNVTYRYWWRAKSGPKISAALKATLLEHAEERAKTCIINGYHSGELNCYWHVGTGSADPRFKEWELRGWWEIQR